jgi:hypothetical protein
MKLSRFVGAFCAIGLSLNAVSAMSAPVDFNTWTPESYPAVSSFPAGQWNVAGGGSSVNQVNNGQPTFFYSDFNTQGSAFTGSITVTGSDDDYIGFALGFQPGDSTSPAADYLLIDWKAVSQNFDFNGGGDGPGGIAERGLAVSRVTGVPTADEFWQHVDNDLTGSPLGAGLQELQRGNNLSDTGWVLGTTYEFTFDFGPNNLDVFVNSVLELSIVGNFNDGRFGFYNFSQAGVNYSGFTKDPGSFPSAVPVPAAVWLFGTALVGFIGYSRRRNLA